MKHERSRRDLLTMMVVLVGVLTPISPLARTCPSPVMDEDGNGFQDRFEQIVVYMFCPSLALQSTELAEFGVNTSPEPVEIMTGSLWAELHDVNGAYSGEEDVSLFLGGNYSWLDNDDDNFSGHGDTYNCGSYMGCYRTYNFEYAGLSSDCDTYGGFYEDPQGWYNVYKNGRYDVSPPIQPGAAYPPTVYAHPFRSSDSRYVIQYWFFYPFNDGANNHEGDWEHINVEITSDDPNIATIHKVVYWFHRWFKECDVSQVDNPVEFEYFISDGTHPVVFVGGHAATEFAGIVGTGNATHGSFPGPGGWGIDKPPLGSLLESVDGIGEWVPWTNILASTADDRYGVVLLKEPEYYDYGVNPAMAWLKADVNWGHNFVRSPGTSVGLNIENHSPRGPVYQGRWNNLNQATGDFTCYPYTGPDPSLSGWIPPPVSGGPTRDLIVAPIEGSIVSGIFEVKGTAGVNDKELRVDWGFGTTPTEWFTGGVELYWNFGPFVNLTYASFDTNGIPQGTITLRVRTYNDGIQAAEKVIQLVVEHQSTLVAADGSGQFASIQSGINSVDSGDTVYVKGPGEYAENIVLKDGVHIVARGSGAAIVGVSDNSSVTLTDNCSSCTLDGFVITHQEGTVGYQARGLHLVNADIIIKNCTISGNAAMRGGGAVVDGESVVRFEGCEFTNNKSVHNVSQCGASAVEVWGTTPPNDASPGNPVVSFVDCDITNNSVDTFGISAGPPVTVSFLYDMYPPGPADPQPRFERCRISGNVVQTAVIHFSNCYKPELVDCVIVDNVNPIYHLANGVVYCHSSGIDLENCTIAKNRNLTGYRMSGIYTDGYPCPGGCDRDISHSVIAFNDGPAVGAGSWISTVSMTDCDVFGNVNPSGTYGPTDAQWVTLGTNVINADPAFCAAGTGDYSIYAFSPCAPGVTSEDLIGASPVGCVPGALVETVPYHLIGPDSIFTTCPAGDLEVFGIDVDFDDAVITREIGASEIRIEPPANDSIGFFANQGVIPASAPAGPPDFTTSIRHAGIGGHGIDSVGVLLNGHLLNDKAFLNLRSVDYNGDGRVTSLDLARLSTLYPSPPHTYVCWLDYNNDFQFTSLDVAVFANHYGHESPYLPPTTSPDGPQVDVSLRFAFTEEQVPDTRRLCVDVIVNQAPPFSVMALLVQVNNAALTFREWLSDNDHPNGVMFAPTFRDGGEHLFFGVASTPDAPLPIALGQLVFDIADGVAPEVSESDFELTLADLMTTQGTTASVRGVRGLVGGSSEFLGYKNRLSQNYPNPFNPTTAIEYSLSRSGHVELVIFNVAGQLVRTLVDEGKPSMNYRIFWDGTDNDGSAVASGVYFYRLRAPGFTSTKKMVLLR